MTSQELPSMVGGPYQLVESPNLLPFVSRSNIWRRQANLPVDISDPLDVCVGGVGSGVVRETTRNAIANCSGDVFFERSSFDLYNMDTAPEGSNAPAALQKEGRNCAFGLNPVTSVPSIHWSCPAGWLSWHRSDYEVLYGVGRKVNVRSPASHANSMQSDYQIYKMPNVVKVGGGGDETEGFLHDGEV